MSTRLNKYLAHSGVCARRKADELIATGVVRINGKVAQLGDQVEEHDRVTVNGKPVEKKRSSILIMLNKPVGMIVTADPEAHNSVVQYINHQERLFPIGRLDVASSGLQLLTNDGALANRLTHPRYQKEKEYEVDVQRAISDFELAQLRAGIMLEDGPTLPSQITRLEPKRFSIVLNEGRNRQIRRMCEALGHTITRLHRTRIAHLRLGTLAPGKSKQISIERFK